MRLPLLLLLLSMTISAQAVDVDERERLRDDLTRSLNELAEVQSRLLASAEHGGLPLPSGVLATLAARRTLAADWLKRMGDATVDFAVEEADGFREGVDGLRGRLDGVNVLLEQSNSADERWPRAAQSAEYTRYRAFLRSRVDQALLEIAAGAEHPDDEEMLWRRLRRHEILLQLVESGQQVTERWPLVLANAPALREYQEVRSALRTNAELGLQQGNLAPDHEIERDEQVLWLLDEAVSLVQGREERLQNREIPADAPLLPSFHAALAAEEQALRAQIAHRRTPITDDSVWHRQYQELQRARELRSRLTGLAWEGLEIDLAILDRRRHLTELLLDAPAALQTAATARVTALVQQRTAVITALNKALAAGSRVDALHARSSLRILSRDVDGFVEEFEQSRERVANEQEWRARAGEPGVAAALAKLDAAWAAMGEARTRQIDADHAAIRSDLARELAEVEAEVAQQAAERSRDEMDRAREALDRSREQVVDALENPQPKPEGDAKF